MDGVTRYVEQEVMRDVAMEEARERSRQVARQQGVVVPAEA